MLSMMPRSCASRSRSSSAWRFSSVMSLCSVTRPPSAVRRSDTRSQQPSASWRSNGSLSPIRLRATRSLTEASSRPTASGMQPDQASRRASSAKLTPGRMWSANAG
jgi:hypothetical protein